MWWHKALSGLKKRIDRFEKDESQFDALYKDVEQRIRRIEEDFGTVKRMQKRILR